MSALEDVAGPLREAGLSITEHEYYFDVICEWVSIWVELRPTYCNRGTFLVNANSNDPARITIDWADGFPRYYFSAECCVSELLAWMAARELPESRPVAR